MAAVPALKHPLAAVAAVHGTSGKERTAQRTDRQIGRQSTHSDNVEG